MRQRRQAAGRASAARSHRRRHARRASQRFGRRASHVARVADQIAFRLYLPGVEMMLAASLHSVHEGERIATLAAPDRRDAADYECPAMVQMVRLVRHIASTGKMRVLMTNLLDPVAFPAHEFGDLYHQRWRIEEAFKRLKHWLNLEHVSGLSQQSALHEFAAKIVCDSLQSLATETALRQPSLPPTRRIHRAAAQSISKPVLSALLLGADIATRLLDALHLIAGRTYSHRPGIIIFKSRVARPKSHKFTSQKPC